MLAWTLVAATSVLLAGFSGLLTPVNLHDGAGTTVRDCVVSSISGLCGGGLLALACATMLPAAYERAGRGAAVMGLLAPTGFVASASAFHPFCSSRLRAALISLNSGAGGSAGGCRRVPGALIPGGWMPVH